MMFGSSDDSYDKDRATNMSAVTVQLGVSARTIDTRESYEHTYNTGCNYDCVGDSVAAEEALTSDEKAIGEYWEAEVGIIKVQLRYKMRTLFTTSCLGTSQATSSSPPSPAKI